jgi:hypothetical protein
MLNGTSSTYPPSPQPPTSTMTVPPSVPTASTGLSSDAPMFFGVAIILALCGAIMLRVASKRAKAFMKG